MLMLCSDVICLKRFPSSSSVLAIWPARLTFELTHQDSEGGKNCTVLTSMQLFSFETARNIHEKALIISKSISDCKTWVPCVRQLIRNA